MKKILIVDDEKNVRVSLSIGLVREGYLVEVAGDAQEALSKLRETIFDYVLTDIKMPHTNGIELANQVAKEYPSTRTILMSAYDFRDFEKTYQELSKYPRLSKPFEMRDVKDTLCLLNNEHDYNFIK